MATRSSIVLFILAFALALVGCASHPAASEETQVDQCLTSRDGCSGRVKDPCSAYKTKASCQNDKRCEGLPFVESALGECEFDDRCFSKVCPSVGCISTCELMDKESCLKFSTRCELKGGACVKRFPCPQKYNIPPGERAQSSSRRSLRMSRLTPIVVPEAQ